jgi:16S rRNA (uracil1498-N3)-methyltransferase
MSDRYFAEQPIRGDRAELAGPEAHHLIHVMRAKSGSRVLLFDGGGEEFTAVVDRGGRDRVEQR